MEPDFIICMRCLGRKRIYKVVNGYSYVNTGGFLVDCPMCLGKGKTKSLEAASTEADKKKGHKKKDEACEEKSA